MREWNFAGSDGVSHANNRTSIFNASHLCRRRVDRCRSTPLAGEHLHSMDGNIKNILNAVVVIAVVIYLLQVFGLIGTLEGIKVGHISRP